MNRILMCLKTTLKEQYDIYVTVLWAVIYLLSEFPFAWVPEKVFVVLTFVWALYFFPLRFCLCGKKDNTRNLRWFYLFSALSAASYALWKLFAPSLCLTLLLWLLLAAMLVFALKNARFVKEMFSSKDNERTVVLVVFFLTCFLLLTLLVRDFAANYFESAVSMLFP